MNHECSWKDDMTFSFDYGLEMLVYDLLKGLAFISRGYSDHFTAIADVFVAFATVGPMADAARVEDDLTLTVPTGFSCELDHCGLAHGWATSSMIKDEVVLLFAWHQKYAIRACPIRVSERGV